MENSKTINVGVVVTSRNNYNMLNEHWFPNMGRCPFDILNIDEDSDASQKKYGRNLCKKLGITYLDREKRGMHYNMLTAANFFNDKKYLIWFQHDCWPLYAEKFYERFNALVSSGKLDDFGTVGFNGLATDVVKNYKPHRKLIKKGGKPIGVVARCPLEPSRNWYVGIGSKHNKPILHELFNKQPFSVEIPAWFAIALNIKKFHKFIEPCGDYVFWHSWDDLCFQFLKQNVHNLVLPSYYICHRPDLKPSVGIPARSTKSISRFHPAGGAYGPHLAVWKKRWGFNWTARKSYLHVRERYKNTLLDEFFNHDPDNGPLRSFEL